jgi:hypothetical protein
MEFADPATPWKQRILESFSTDGVRLVATVDA